MSSAAATADDSGLGREALAVLGRTGSRFLVNLITQDPIDPFFAAAEAGVDLVSLAWRAWRAAGGRDTQVAQTRDVETVVVAAVDHQARKSFSSSRPGASGGLLHDGEVSSFVDIGWVSERARQIAASSTAGTDFDNWLQAVAEFRIGQRAGQLAAAGEPGGDIDHWLRAEADVLIIERAQQIASTPGRGSDLENWLAAEVEVETRLRARQIANGPEDHGDVQNWLRAEREVLTARRAKEIALSPEGGDPVSNWLRAERELRADGKVV